MTNNTITQNRILNNGIPNISGFGSAMILGGSGAGVGIYGTISGNYGEFNRGGIQVQGNNTAAAFPAVISDNTFVGVEAIGVFLNVMSGTANDWTITGNTISGKGFDQGTAAFAIISQTDGATPRRHVISNNNASDIAGGFYFSNNTTLNQTISGGTLDNVLWAMTVANRLGYNGYIDYSFNGAPALRDGTGGPAAFNSATATAALEAGLTAEIMVPDALDAADGQTPFANTDFTGKIALITLNPSTQDASIAAQNAANAGAVGVIVTRTGSTQPPFRLASTFTFPLANASVDIPTTMIDQADGTALKDALTLGDTIEATMNNLFFRTNGFGVAAPAVITGASSGTLVNVTVNNAQGGGFAVINVPNEIGPGGTPGAVSGKVIGGSSINNAPFGVLIDGDNASFEANSSRFAGNGVGIEIRDASFVANGVILDGNTTGISVSGASSTADIQNSDFINQTLDVDLADNPTAFQVINSNFDATGTAIENNTPLLGDVLATGNFWGDASGPDDDAGVINGTGARISLGVNAADFLPDPVLVATDTDGDGLTDSQENTLGTNPAVADTDTDGIPDGVEVARGWDPLDIDDPVVGGSATDTDGDNIPDAVELILGTNENDPDTDGDGIRDDYELLRGTDATNALSFPPFGDANFSGTVNATDAIAILEAFLGLRDFNTINRPEIDINQDGILDNIDAVILFQRTIGNIPYIPFP